MQNRINIVAVSSITYAMKAQDVLTSSGIASSIVRLHPGQTPNGCAYGINVNNRDLGRISSLLNGTGLTYRIIK